MASRNAFRKLALRAPVQGSAGPGATAPRAGATASIAPDNSLNSDAIAGDPLAAYGELLRKRNDEIAEGSSFRARNAEGHRASLGHPTTDRVIGHTLRTTGTMRMASAGISEEKTRCSDIGCQT